MKISKISYSTILASLSFLVGYCYYSQVLYPSAEGGLAVHKAIIQGDILSPYRYRVLIPRIMDPLIQFMAGFTTEYRAFLFMYGLFGLVSIFFIFLTLSVYLNELFPREVSLIGILFVAASLPISFMNAVFQPWGLSETVIFTIALILVFKKKIFALAALVLVATFNRETAVFIPFIYLFANFKLALFKRDGFTSWNTWKPVVIFFIYLACWAVVFLGLRLWLGQAEQVQSISWLWDTNTQRNLLIRAVINILLFMGAFWLFALLAFPKAPSFLRRTSLVILLYLPAVLIFGLWYEVRLLMPLYALVVPLALYYLFPQEEKLTNWESAVL